MVFLEGAKNEKLAIGYGHVSQDKLVYAMSNLSQFNNDFVNYTDTYSLIQANFMVQMLNTGGTPQIVVRGISSISENVGAMYAFYGTVVNDISYITPGNIKSIDIIKDFGAAIYGVRGANGVILITTIGSKP